MSWLLLITTALCSAGSDVGIKNPLITLTRNAAANQQRKAPQSSRYIDSGQYRMSTASASDSLVQGEQQFLKLRHEREEGSAGGGSGVNSSQFLTPEVPVLEDYPLNLLNPVNYSCSPQLTSFKHPHNQ